MAESKRPIPMPLRIRMLVLRRRILPGVFFVACLAGTMFLWQRQQYRATVRGQVEAEQVLVTATSDGMLARLPEQVDVFDPVIAGATVVAQLDVAPAQAEIEVIRAEQAALQAQFAVEQSELQLEQLRYAMDLRRSQSDQQRQVGQLREELVEYQLLRNQLQLRRIELITQQAIAQHEKKRLQDRIEHTRLLVAKEVASDFALQDAINELSVIEAQIVESDKTRLAIDRQIDDAVARAAEAQSRLEETLGQSNVAESEDASLADRSFNQMAENRQARLSALERAVEVQESRIREVMQRKETFEIRAPITGAVAAIFQRPGTWVRQGDPILSIAKHEADHIVAYLPSGDRRRIEPAMSVQVLVGAPKRSRYEAKVRSVGAHLEPIPDQFLGRDPPPEWGVPVQIVLPADAHVRPGEFVEVVFPAADDA